MVSSPVCRRGAEPIYDPAPALKKLKCSVLTMNGERDRQVPTENLINTAVALELMSQ